MNNAIDDAENYAVIDSTNNVINIIRLTSPIIFDNGDKTVLLTGNGVSIGWTYVNGEFVNPNPPVISEPFIPLPSPAPTLSDLQSQMAQLQAHMSTLLAQPSS